MKHGMGDLMVNYEVVRLMMEISRDMRATRYGVQMFDMGKENG